MLKVVLRLFSCCLILGAAAWGVAEQAGEAAKPESGETPAAEPAAESPGESPAEKPSAKTAPSKLGPAGSKFVGLFEGWKDLLAQLRKLYEEHKLADPGRRAEIEIEYAKLIKKGEAMEPEVVAAAEAAYAEDPKSIPQLEQFLVSMVENRIRRDDYEEAFRVAQLLIENRCSDKRVYNWAGYAAFCVGNYDAAETYFKLAKENAAFRELGKNPLDAIVQDFVRDPKPFKADWQRELELREAEKQADDLPRVRLETSKGDVVIELFENEAPNTVANFISLVEKDFYDGVAFHRVLDGFMAQGGDPLGDGTGGPGYTIACECYEKDRRKHFRGTLSMAHAGRDTGGSQFFLTFVPTTHLDTQIDPATGEFKKDPRTGKPLPGHTVFGRVVEGMEVLSKLRRRSPTDPNAPPADKIVKAEVIRKRDHAYEPEKTEK